MKTLSIDPPMLPFLSCSFALSGLHMVMCDNSYCLFRLFIPLLPASHILLKESAIKNQEYIWDGKKVEGVGYKFNGFSMMDTLRWIGNGLSIQTSKGPQNVGIVVSYGINSGLRLCLLPTIS